MGFTGTVGRWGGIWGAENLSGRERWEQRLGCMSEFGAQNELPKGSRGREKGVSGSGETDRSSLWDGDIRIGDVS